LEDDKEIRAMDTREYKERSDKLFADWKARLQGDVYPATDGAIDPGQYYDPANKPRILFVLKEMNAAFWEPNSLVEYLAEVNTRPQTWDNVVRWARVIRSASAGGTTDLNALYDQPPIDRDARINELASVAVMNLKKTTGTGDSHMPTINMHAERYGDLLWEQFMLLDPDVIVACGVRLTDIKGLKEVAQPKTDWSRYDVAGKLRTFIWSYHPQARGKSQSSFETMAHICTEAFGLGR